MSMGLGVVYTLVGNVPGRSESVRNMSVLPGVLL
ncbi:MAG: hypothetical protein GAK38_02238 [Xylophilus sp.]|nr:MAG: hypothetical protein GAK38_02238 [Xylophilus sp.]